MLIACWSVKGGVGTTVVAAGLGLSVAARAGTRPALLVDLAGDLPACLGLADPPGPGVADWSVAGGALPDALGRLETPVRPGLTLLHRGRGPLDPDRCSVLVQVLAASGRTVVFDCGLVSPGSGVARIAAEAERSLLVTRLCLLGLRRADRAPVRPSGVVVVREPGRALTVQDAGSVIGAPVVADVAVDPAVARAVDAGLLTSRVPRPFGAALAAVAA